VRSFLLLFTVAIVGCSTQPELDSIELKTLDNKPAYIQPTNNSLSVLFFLSPECPLCINYTLAMTQLANEFQNDSIVFYGLHSANWFTANEVEAYRLKYELPFTMLLDEGNHVAKALGASVTPEVFVLNSNAEVIYNGKIDNWVNELGKKKLEVTDHYLKNALVNWRNGKAIQPQRTEPKGCLIE
jgi:thiol-disulfide isomerase/thioredoxin